MTRHSEHAVSVSLTNAHGGIVVPAAIDDARVNLSEAQSPYGQVSVTVPMPADEGALEVTNPRHGDVRLMIDMRESVGDPVRVSEITAEHEGSVASMTAMFTGHVAPITQRYFVGWNNDDELGSALRGNFLVTSRGVDHSARTVTYEGFTDEALATAYRLLSRGVETSGSLFVRATVNFALSKIGAALVPGTVDAPIVEADAIIWEPGTSAWEYMRNVAESAGLVVRCDERRRWTLTRRDTVRADVIVLNRHTEINERIDLAGAEFADGVVIRYEWRDPAADETHVTFDTASKSANPIKVILIERDVPFPGRGAAAYWLKRFGARGRVFDISQVSDYSIRPGMQFSTDVPVTPTQVGHVETVDWVFPDAAMTITTTGSADAVEGAIDLFPAGLFIDDLTGFINDLNPGSEAA